MSDFWDEVLYTLNRVREIAQDIGYILKNFPSIFQMRGFYNTFQSADLPYGRIYDLDTALRQSGKSPFSPDWFVFGQDNYFSFWLCTKGKADEGLYFTYWDHESGLEIEEPAWEDLLTFLNVEREAEK